MSYLFAFQKTYFGGTDKCLKLTTDCKLNSGDAECSHGRTLYYVMYICINKSIGLQWYNSILVHHNTSCHDTNIVYWTSYCDIYDTFTYASTNMGKHCLQLVLTLLASTFYSLCTVIFQTNWWEKSRLSRLFSVLLKMADTTNTCVLLTRLLSCTDFWAHEQDMRRQVCNTLLVLFLCNISYRDNCIRIHTVSWKNVLLQAYTSTHMANGLNPGMSVVCLAWSFG